MTRSSSNRVSLPLLAVLPCLLAACDREEVRSYAAPKDDVQAVALPEVPPPDPAASSRVPGPERPMWTLPDGWVEQPGSGMRFATLVIGDEDPLEIRVTPLGPMARDPLSNANRWGEQIGLPPLTQEELGSVLRQVPSADGLADLIRLVGPETSEGRSQILAAILPTEERVWFFLLQGPAERVSPIEKDFEQFLRGITFAPATPPGGTSPPSSTPSTDAPSSDTLAWSLPEGWVQQEGSSSMRVASFRAPSGAEVAITRFPGDVGGVLANVNRWRGQVELPPIGDPSEQPAEAMEVSGSPAAMYDFVGPSEDPAEASRMVVVLVARAEETWFVKMTGHHHALEEARAGFEAFTRSLELPGAP